MNEHQLRAHTRISFGGIRNIQLVLIWEAYEIRNEKRRVEQQWSVHTRKTQTAVADDGAIEILGCWKNQTKKFINSQKTDTENFTFHHRRLTTKCLSLSKISKANLRQKAALRFVSFKGRFESQIRKCGMNEIKPDGDSIVCSKNPPIENPHKSLLHARALKHFHNKTN